MRRIITLTVSALFLGCGSAVAFEPNPHSASLLIDGPIPDDVFPATLPAVSGQNLTDLDAASLTDGPIPDGVFPTALPSNVSAWNTGNGSATVRGATTWRAGTLYTTDANTPPLIINNPAVYENIDFSGHTGFASNRNALEVYNQGTSGTIASIGNVASGVSGDGVGAFTASFPIGYFRMSATDLTQHYGSSDIFSVSLNNGVRIGSGTFDNVVSLLQCLSPQIFYDDTHSPRFYGGAAAIGCSQSGHYGRGEIHAPNLLWIQGPYSGNSAAPLLSDYQESAIGVYKDGLHFVNHYGAVPVNVGSISSIFGFDDTIMTSGSVVSTGTMTAGGGFYGDSSGLTGWSQMTGSSNSSWQIANAFDPSSSDVPLYFGQGVSVTPTINWNSTSQYFETVNSNSGFKSDRLETSNLVVNGDSSGGVSAISGEQDWTVSGSFSNTVVVAMLQDTSNFGLTDVVLTCSTNGSGDTLNIHASVALSADAVINWRIIH